MAQKIIEFDEVMSADIVFCEYYVISRRATTDLDKVRTITNALVTSTMLISKKGKRQKFYNEKQIKPHLKINLLA